MVKEAKAKAGAVKSHYWNGVFSGVFLGCFILSVLILAVIRFQGFKVFIDPGQLAGMVQAKVREEARQDLPRLLENFKKDLPQKIDNNLDEVNNLKIGIGSSEIKLPEEAILAIKSEFNRIIETAIINTFNDYDTAEYENKIANNVYEMVENLLRREVIGKTYLIKSTEWLSVPVKIVSSGNAQIKTGI